MNLDVEIGEYVQSVINKLECGSLEKSKHFAFLQSLVDAYIIDNPEATLEDILCIFGTPQEFAQNLLIDEIEYQIE